MRELDRGSAGDADLCRDISAGLDLQVTVELIGVNGFAEAIWTCVPELSACGFGIDIIGVEGIDAVVLGSNDRNIRLPAAFDGGLGDDQWLRVEIAINGARSQLTEAARLYVAGIELGFVEVCARAREVIVMLEYIHLAIRMRYQSQEK